MIIQLPLENWADLLPFVPRRQLVALLFQLGDPRLASILQYCLNEEGRITLGHLHILAPKENNAINGPILQLCQSTGLDMPPILETTLPDVPIPKNVHSFNSIKLSYFDSSVLDFLQKFHQHKNALLSNMNLSISHLPMEKVQPVMAQILPLIGDNIDSLELYDHQLLGYSRLLNNIQCIGNTEEFSEQMTKMLARTRILSIGNCYYLAFNWYCSWLYTPRMDGRPRMLSMSLLKGDALHFIDLIKKDFLMAINPATFIIHMQPYPHPPLEFENIRLENGGTNENLVVEKRRELFLISRFPMAAANDANWIQANEHEILEFVGASHDRTIYLG